MKRGTKNVKYAYRGKHTVPVKIPVETRDRVAKLARVNGVTLGYQIEQLLVAPLKEAEQSASI